MKNQKPLLHESRPRIRVLVAEDSPVARELLTHILNSDPGIHVIDSVGTGEEAIQAASLERPDIITMDIHLPGINGFEATRTIMETTPVPIVIVTSSCDMRTLENSFKAIDAGALSVLEKPQGIGHPNFTKNVKDLITTIKLMSEIKVVRRWSQKQRTMQSEETIDRNIVPASSKVEVVAIGASTGGPPVIERILSGLPKTFAPPILIVQHMTEGFIRGFTEWLGQTSALPVHLAFNGSIARGGHVYIAPDNLHMKIDPGGRIACLSGSPKNGVRPSVSILFETVALRYGKNAVGVLLTGMGKDGAEELKVMRDKGAITIAQDEQTSAVYGMPKEAVKLDAAKYILPVDRVASVLTTLTKAKIVV